MLCRVGESNTPELHGETRKVEMWGGRLAELPERNIFLYVCRRSRVLVFFSGGSPCACAGVLTGRPGIPAIPERILSCRRGRWSWRMWREHCAERAASGWRQAHSLARCFLFPTARLAGKGSHLQVRAVMFFPQYASVRPFVSYGHLCHPGEHPCSRSVMYYTL